ncbi:hypothetical protein TCAL_08684 [Tigriopus californicus]|uniref:DNA recombination and repair protein Rad51-like C-terminal domain-containing protein n=2 Tax=Tigriopus californicus TaxID=6832 RepID=A0A553NB60_TIGCA|nr:hypothetical protein TCAL_08684 [Tigriopus californicus]|eukprot:TCALIF_08684-PA protein Name:"Similar to Xrcc2 DNA repair protein XRCC2 (Mus musculus)" AED:0.51 eAED:0.52 QI:0/-1/0/1/-1/1/1/0/233
MPRPTPRSLACLPCRLGTDQVMEIHGATGTGKSLYLAHIITQVLTGSENGEVLFINVDHTINAYDFHDMLSQQVGSDMSKKHLKRLLMVDICELEDFQGFLNVLPAAISSNANLFLIAIDSLGSFYYVERLSTRIYSHDSYVKQKLKKVMDCLGNIKIPIIFTKQDIFSVNAKTTKGPKSQVKTSIQLENTQDTHFIKRGILTETRGLRQHNHCFKLVLTGTKDIRIQPDTSH